MAPTCVRVGLLEEQVDDVVILADTFGIDLPESNAWISARLGVIREIAPVPLSPEIAAAFDGAIQRPPAAYEAKPTVKEPICLREMS